MTIAERLRKTRDIIQNTALQCGRNPHEITLIGVTKGQPIEAIIEAHKAGLTDFGESYWQEAQTKIPPLSDLPITWHFIGPIQSNKAEGIANHFEWVHSVDREKIAHLLATHRKPELPSLNVCIQVNLDREMSKSGISPEQVHPFLQQLQTLPNIAVRGLMAIPEPLSNPEEQYRSFMRLTTLQDELNRRCEAKLDTLSMGMSDDFVAAIRAGSTMVRIGQAIFGPRQK